MITDRAVRRAALGGIAASLVLGLAACGNALAGAAGGAKPGGAAQPATASPAASHIDPAGPAMPNHIALCMEIPRLIRVSVTRTPFPVVHAARERLPAVFTVTNVAQVRRIATLLCALPAIPHGVLSCPDLIGGSYRLYFTAPGRAIPAVTAQSSGCLVVTGLGPPRTWATSMALREELSYRFRGRFRAFSPLP
jgi:hypothetical protein